MDIFKNKKTGAEISAMQVHPGNFWKVADEFNLLARGASTRLVSSGKPDAIMYPMYTWLIYVDEVLPPVGMSSIDFWATYDKVETEVVMEASEKAKGAIGDLIIDMSVSYDLENDLYIPAKITQPSEVISRLLEIQGML